MKVPSWELALMSAGEAGIPPLLYEISTGLKLRLIA